MKQQISQVLAEARRAQSRWAARSFKERALVVMEIRDYLVTNAERIAATISEATGKPRIEALAAEVLPCALACSWYAHNAKKFLGPRRLPTSSMLFFNKKTELHRQPLGLVAIVSPWNYPFAIPFGEVIMGLMAGNGVILKVAEETLRVGRLIAEIINASSIEPGLFAHLEGDGAEITDELFAQGIDKLFFTGSVRVGKLLMKKASETLTPLCLELGGKDPMVVLEDADLERATNGAVWGGFQNAGQTCAGIERIYVHEKIYAEFIALLASKTRALRQGPDTSFNSEIGQITTDRQLTTITRQVDAALRKGAKILAQARLTAEAPGRFYPATVLIDVDHTMEVMSEETFGPVLGVMKFASLEEAVSLANGSTYALTASLWTRNLAKGKELAQRLDAGVCTINDHLFTHALAEIPWGGFKQSGIGRTHGGLGLEEMTQVKCINWDWLSPKRNVYWYPYSAATYQALLAALRFAAGRAPLKAAAVFLPYYLRKVFSSWRLL